MSLRTNTDFALNVMHGLILEFKRQFLAVWPHNGVPNLHAATHLRESCRDFSVPAAFWTFSLERLQGLLGSVFNNYTHIAHTVADRFLLRQALADLSRLQVTLHDGSQTDFLSFIGEMGLPLEWFHDADLQTRITAPAGPGVALDRDALREWYWYAARSHHPLYAQPLRFLRQFVRGRTFESDSGASSMRVFAFCVCVCPDFSLNSTRNLSPCLHQALFPPRPRPRLRPLVPAVCHPCRGILISYGTRLR